MNSRITSIVDKHLQKIIEKEMNFLPMEIAIEMRGSGKGLSPDWNEWLPVKSHVTSVQLNELERTIGYSLPASYRQFLQYKHFYELMIDEVNFCRHSSDKWQEDILELVFNSYPRELVIDQGAIPFAVFSDWGLLCFDTKAPSTNNDYIIVL